MFPSNYVKLDALAEDHLTFRRPGVNTGTYNVIMCARCAVSYLLGHSYADMKVVLWTSTRAERMFCKNINKSSSFIAAIDYFQKALGVSEGYHRAKEGMEKAQKLLKQSKKRDYYKILGVAR